MTNTPPDDPDGDKTPAWRTARPAPNPTPAPPSVPPATPPPGAPTAPAPPPHTSPPPPPADATAPLPPPPAPAASPPYGTPAPAAPPSGPPTGPPAGAPGPATGGYPTGGYPAAPPPSAKSKAPLFIVLGVVALVAVVVIAIVGVSLLGGDDTESTTTTEDTRLDDARQDLRAALEDDDREEVSALVEDEPELLDDSVDAPRGETTAVTLDDEEGLGVAAVPATLGEGFRTDAGSDDVGGLVLDPDGQVVSALGEVTDPVADGDHTVLLFSADGDGGEVDLTVNRVTSELLFVDDEVDGTIETAGDLARYEIDLEEAMTYTVLLEGEGATATVSDPDGEEVDTSAGDEGQDLEAPVDGTYVVEVAGDGDATPTFTLSVVLVPDFSITNLFDGAPATSPFFYEYATPEEADTLFGQFRVAINPGVTVRVTSTPEGGGDVQLSVRRPGQPDQTFNDAPPGQPESYEITVDGPTPIDFQSEIINSVPDKTTITVEAVS